MLTPKHTEFMDEDMLVLWNTMSPSDLPDYRLYGGTALALYLNHRKSTDFDFFKQGDVRRKNLETIPWLKNASFKGAYGLVDAILPGPSRNLTLNFVSIETFNTIPPTHPPIKAINGIDIAHPVDVLACKLTALANRRLFRDYFDIATATMRIPEMLDEAIEIYLGDSMTQDESPIDLAKTLLRYSFEIEYELPPPQKKALLALAAMLNEMPPHNRINQAGQQDKKTRKESETTDPAPER